jgi:hypothetical protein
MNKAVKYSPAHARRSVIARPFMHALPPTHTRIARQPPPPRHAPDGQPAGGGGGARGSGAGSTW